jgi:methyl-accepting chemotaxis protein
MTESKRSTPSQDESIRRAVLVGQSLVVSTFLFVALAAYLAFTTGAWQSFSFVFLGVVLEVLIFIGIASARRGQLKTAGWLLLGMNLIGGMAGAVFYVGLGYLGPFYILISSFFVIIYVLPREERRLAFVLIGISVVICISMEVINPAWRQLSQLVQTLAPTFTLLMGIAFTAIIARQAWSGNIRVKIITAFTIVALTSLAIMGTVTYINYRNKVREDIRQRLLNIVTITAIRLDGDLHATLQTPEDMQKEAYRQMMAEGDEIIATDPDLIFSYTMRMNEQGQIYFVIDSRRADDTERDAIGTIYDEPSETLQAFFNAPDRPIVEEEIYTDKYGSVLSAFAPFYRADGSLEGIFGIDIAAEKVIAEEQAVLRLILITTAITMVFVTLLGLFLGNVFAKPIIHLSQVAQKITAGDLSARAEIETTDEVGDLANTLNAMTSQLQSTLQGLEQRVDERTRALTASTEVSRRLSTILDPKQLVKEVVDQVQDAFDFYHVHIYLKDEASGDLIMAGGTGEAGVAMLARGHKIPKGRGLVGRSAETNAPVLVPDTSKDINWLPNPLLPDTKSEVAVPISIGNEVMGVLDVQQNIVDGLKEDDVVLLQSIANQVAIAVRNARSYEESRSQAELETLVNTIGQKIQRAGTVEDVLQTAIREVGLALGASRVSATLQPVRPAMESHSLAGGNGTDPKR